MSKTHEVEVEIEVERGDDVFNVTVHARHTPETAPLNTMNSRSAGFYDPGDAGDFTVLSATRVDNGEPVKLTRQEETAAWLEADRQEEAAHATFVP